MDSYFVGDGVYIQLEGMQMWEKFQNWGTDTSSQIEQKDTCYLVTPR